MPIYHKTPSKRRLHKMNARQHKKFHLGRFQALGFVLSGKLLPEYGSEAHFDAFNDEAAAFAEACSVRIYGGGSGKHFAFAFEHEKRDGIFSETLRQALIDWFAKRHDTAHLRAGYLIDLSYCPQEMYGRYDEICK